MLADNNTRRFTKYRRGYEDHMHGIISAIALAHVREELFRFRR